MTRAFTRFVGEQSRTPLTISTLILLSAVAAAQKPMSSGTQSSPSGSTPTMTWDTTPKNKLFFPYGVQSFETRENLKVGNEVSALPGWQFKTTPSMVDAFVTEHNHAVRPGTNSRRFLAIEDLGGGANQGFASPILSAPTPWDYAWTFAFMVQTAPISGFEAPAFAVQHLGNVGFADAWGIRLTETGGELFINPAWGTSLNTSLFQYSGATDIGEWIEVRVVASLQKNTLTAFVNGEQVTMIRTRPPATTDVKRHRFAFNGGGAGNGSSMLLDDVGVAFLGGGVCNENLDLTFTTEDDTEKPLANGQAIDDPPEFGEKLFITGSGLNRGPAIFDSSDPGPNNPGQDPDLLVNQGNLLILQNDDANNPPAVADLYPRPNDDEDGGTLQFDFMRPLQPLQVDLIDIDNPNQGATITLTDFSNLTRTYTVPTNWTGDITLAEPGVGTLDLTTLLPQAGHLGNLATAVEDAGYDPNAVMSMTVELSGSGALDNFKALIPCVLLAFEVEDDSTPVFTGTTLANGQDISDPPEFGVEVSIGGSLGNHVGPAIFDSTPGGVNDQLGKPDRDLCVGLGNILILQNNLFATQTTTGFYDIPNDDTEGGRITFAFVSPTVQVNKIDLIDVDEEESVGITVTLEDLGGNLRVYSVPIGWTEDRLNDGPPAFRTLDLTTLAPQPGYDPPGPPPAPNATGVDIGPFDPDEVVEMRVDLGGAQAIDNICFCP